MRPSIDVDGLVAFGCVGCGGRVRSPDSRTCADCGGVLPNLRADRDL